MYLVSKPEENTHVNGIGSDGESENISSDELLTPTVVMRNHNFNQQMMSKRMSLPANVHIPQACISRCSPTTSQPMSRRLRRASLVSFFIFKLSNKSLINLKVYFHKFYVFSFYFFSKFFIEFYFYEELIRVPLENSFSLFLLSKLFYFSFLSNISNQKVLTFINHFVKQTDCWCKSSLVTTNNESTKLYISPFQIDFISNLLDMIPL